MDKISIDEVQGTFKEAAQMLDQALLLFTLRDVVGMVDCPEREEARELYLRINRVSKWLKENSI